MSRTLCSLAATIWLINGCSSFAQRRVNLRSSPDGAEVVSVGGKNLGKTPLTLEKEQLDEVAVDGRLDVILRAPRYVERQLTLEIVGEDTYTVRLIPLDEHYFDQRLLEDYRSQANELTRHLMSAQGLAFAGKVTEAEHELTDIEKRFPNLAPIYVLRAEIERLKGDHEKTRGYLRRALSLDPRDPVATRLLETENKKGSDK